MNWGSDKYDIGESVWWDDRVNNQYPFGQVHIKLTEFDDLIPICARQLSYAEDDRPIVEKLECAPPLSAGAWPRLSLKELPDALPFPVDVFPKPLQDYCNKLAESMQTSCDLAGLAMLTVAGAAIGQSLSIEIKVGWREFPLLYSMVVAPPGKTKTPVLRAVVQPLTDIDERLRELSREARRKWREARDQEGEIHELEPPIRQVIVKDCTREALGGVLRCNPRGLLCYRDEGTAWVASFDEYKTKGSDRQFWLSIWSSDPLSIQRTKHSDDIYIPRPFIAVLGGLTPDMLDTLIDERGRNDGFLDRVLFAYPDKFPLQEWNETELPDQSKRAWHNAIENIYYFGSDETRSVELQGEAKSLWVHWFNEHAREMEAISDSQAGYWSKLRAYAARFTLILSMLRYASETEAVPDGVLGAMARSTLQSPLNPVSKSDVEGAIKLVNYFKSSMLRVTSKMGGGLADSDSRAIVAWIKRKRLTSFRQADVGADLRRFREYPDELAKALDYLVKVGAIRPRAETSAPSKRGRKPTHAYDVHPDLADNTDNAVN